MATSPDPTILNAEQLAEYGDDAEFIHELMEQFEVEFNENLQGIGGAIDSKQFDSAYLMAHTIKGVTANIGAVQLYESSSRLSTLCHDASIQNSASDAATAEIHRLIHQLHQEKTTWDRVAEQYLASHS
jgi:HPt (histidine-containing phosphotransfer) domain-containing protein